MFTVMVYTTQAIFKKQHCYVVQEEMETIEHLEE